MFAVRGLRHVAVAVAVWSLLLTVTLGSPVVGSEPIRCAPCTPESLSQCPAVAPSCAEVLREPGCGCCLACALKAGELCGIYTAPCGSGLRCTPRPGDPRPLHSLTRGQAVCTESAAPPAPTAEPQTPGRPPNSTVTDAEIRRDSQIWDLYLAGQDLLSFIHLFSLLDQGEPDMEMDNSAIIGSNLPGLPFDPRAMTETQESMKAKLIAIRKKLVEQVRQKRCKCKNLDFYEDESFLRNWRLPQATRGSWCTIWNEKGTEAHDTTTFICSLILPPPCFVLIKLW